MQYTDPRNGQTVETGTFDPRTGQITYSAADLEAISRLGQKEVSPIVGLNPNDMFGSIAQMMDVINNRVATPNSLSSYGGTGIQGVINAPNQFSPINGLGSWTGLPNAPAPYDTAVSTYAGLQAYGAPNFVSPVDNFYHNPNEEAYPNDVKPGYIQAREDAFANPTTIGTGIQQHVSGFTAGKYNTPPAAPYGISLPDDYNISLNRDLSMVPMSYMEQAPRPEALGMHPGAMTGVAAADVAPDTALDPTFGASAGLGLRGPAAPLTDYYTDLTQDLAPSMFGGIGALPGMAMDAVKAPVQGLFDMFSPPEAPDMPAAPQQAAAPSDLFGMFAAPPAAPAQPAAPPGVNVEMVNAVPRDTFTPDRVNQAFSAIPSNKAALAPSRFDPGMLPEPPAAPIESIRAAVEASLAAPPDAYTEANILARSPVPEIPDAPDFAPPLGPMAMLDNTAMAAPPAAPPGNPMQTFGAQMALNVAPDDLLDVQPSIGLTGTPLAGLPSFDTTASLSALEGPHVGMPGVNAAPPAAPTDTAPFAPSRFEMGMPAFPAAPQLSYDTPAALPGMTMPETPAPPTSTAPSLSSGLGAGMYGAPPSPPASLSAALGGMYGAVPAPPTDQFSYSTPAAPPAMTLPETPAFTPQASLANLDLAAPPAQAIAPQYGVQQSFSVPTPEVAPALPAPAAPEMPAVAPPSSVDAAFQAAPQAPVAVPITPGLPDATAPTPSQLAQAAQMMRDQVPAAVAPAAAAPPAAVGVPDVAVQAPALAAPEQAPLGTPLAGNMGLANAIATNVAPSLEALTQQVAAAPAPVVDALPGMMAAPAPAIGVPAAPAAPAAPATPAPQSPAPELGPPVGELPGPPAATPQATAQQPGFSPSVESPTVSPDQFSGGFTPGQPTFGGGPLATNMAGDTMSKVFGGVESDWHGGLSGVNTGQYSNVANLSPLGSALGGLLGGPPSPPSGSMGMDALAGGIGTDTLGFGVGEFGGGSHPGFDGGLSNEGNYADLGGSFDPFGGGGYADTGGSFSGSDFGGTSASPDGGLGPDRDSDDHGW